MGSEVGVGHIVIGRMPMRFGDTPDAWVVLGLCKSVECDMCRCCGSS